LAGSMAWNTWMVFITTFMGGKLFMIGTMDIPASSPRAIVRASMTMIV
jgi:hypothetical protein